jgi:hypothetical protein
MKFSETEQKLLQFVARDLFTELEGETDALEVRQKAFDKVLADGRVVQVQISIHTDVEDFLEDFLTVVVGKYEHPSV